MLIEKCDRAGRTLPVKNGALLHVEIKKLADLSHAQIDGNEDIKVMLKAYAASHSLMYSRKGQVAPEEDTLSAPNPMVPFERLREVEMRLAAADRKNAVLTAENANLRSQLLRTDEVAELIALGGRVKPGEFGL